MQWVRGSGVWDLCPGVWIVLYCILQYLLSNYFKKSHLHQVNHQINNKPGKYYCIVGTPDIPGNTLCLGTVSGR